MKTILKQTFILVVFVLQLCTSLNAQNSLVSFERNNKYGFNDKSGKTIVPEKYDYVEDFKSGLCHVLIGRKHGFIDETGNEIIPLIYDDASTAYEGMASIKLNGKWGCADKTGKVVIPLKYEDNLMFTEGFASVVINGKYGFIDKNDSLVVPAIYESVYVFKDGKANVKLNGKWIYIDKPLKIIPVVADNKKSEATKNRVKKVSKIPLKDIGFNTLGIIFGYPVGYSVFIPPGNHNYIDFYNADSSIIISVKNTGGWKVQKIMEGWDTTNTTIKDNWFYNVGKETIMDYRRTSPVYYKSYFYPYTYGGGSYILIELLTNQPNIGLQELEAVKESIDLQPIPMIEREIAPGLITMGIPEDFKPEKPIGLSAFRSDIARIEVYKSRQTGMLSELTASNTMKKNMNNEGRFTLGGDINFYSDSKVNFVGFWGKTVERGGSLGDEIYYEAYVFFAQPNSKVDECWGIHLKLLNGIPLDLGNDMKEYLTTLRFK